MREWFDNSARGEALRSVAGALVAAGLMTILGPFGTYEAMPAPQRALYWFAVIGLIWLQSDLVMRFLERSLAHRLPRPNLTLPVISAILVALPATARGGGGDTDLHAAGRDHGTDPARPGLSRPRGLRPRLQQPRRRHRRGSGRG